MKTKILFIDRVQEAKYFLSLCLTDRLLVGAIYPEHPVCEELIVGPLVWCPLGHHAPPFVPRPLDATYASANANAMVSRLDRRFPDAGMVASKMKPAGVHWCVGV
ncbi:MAG: hypothetical protein ABI586_08080, partial [Candidatus Nanopelagicales bacterium]